MCCISGLMVALRCSRTQHSLTLYFPMTQTDVLEQCDSEFSDYVCFSNSNRFITSLPFFCVFIMEIWGFSGSVAGCVSIHKKEIGPVAFI